jgi:hypothetical protein
MLISTDFVLFINILPYVDIHWFCLVHPYSSLCWYPLIFSCPSIFCLFWYELILLISTDFVLSIHILTHCDIHLFYLVHPYSVLCWYPVILSVRSIFWHMLITIKVFLSPYSDLFWYQLISSCRSIFWPLLIFTDLWLNV